MKVVFVWPAAEFSVWDVARGYRAALARRIGEENIRDYYLNRRASYHAKALPEEQAGNIQILSKMATETLVCEALYFSATHVLIISGLNFHPIGLWLLEKVKIQAAVILTESPYEDENQAEFTTAYPGMAILTNERTSAQKYGWTYLQHAHDPEVHFPTENTLTDVPPCDVLIIGTGWPERQAFLETVNWDGINLRLEGFWPGLREDDSTSPLKKFYREGFVDNTQINQHYASAKICLNFHRSHPTAESANPRVYEIPACGVLQICDDRMEVGEVFGDAVPTFSTGAELERLIRHYLTHEDERQYLVAQAQKLVQSHTFDQRVGALLDRVTGDISQTLVAV